MELDSGIRVFAPSYRRPGTKSSTQSYLPFCTLVVAESEAEAYRKSGNRVVACPDKAQGNLCRVRNWILDKNQDARGVVILDDDYRAIMRWEAQRSRQLTADEVEELIEHGFALAEQWGAYMWGLNIAFDKGTYRENTPFCTVRYIGGPFQAFRPNPLRYDEALPLKEDYDMTLQHLARYRMALRLNAYQYVVKQNEQAGGCATYRSVKAEREQFAALQKKWGAEIVRTDTGNDKTHRKRVKNFDINPRIMAPIAGV